MQQTMQNSQKTIPKHYNTNPVKLPTMIAASNEFR